MRRFPLAVLLFAAGMLLAPAVASARQLQADLNGDGVGDRVDAGDRATELVIRISHSRRVQRLQADDAIVDLTLADVDRDGDKDLVASTSRHGLHIWINRGRGRFLPRPRVSERSGWRSSLSSLLQQPPRLDSSDEWTDSARPLIQPAPYRSGGGCIASRVGTQGEAAGDQLRFDRPVPRGPPLPLFSF